jgi:hypothetical protein
MWGWALGYSGLALATLAVGIVSYLRFAHAQPSLYMRWFAIENYLSVAFMAGIAATAYARLKGEASATEDLRKVALVCRLSTLRVALSFATLIAGPLFASFATTLAPDTTSFDETLVRVRVWLGVVIGAFALALLQQITTLVALSRYGVPGALVPGLVSVGVRVVVIAVMFAALRALGDFAQSRLGRDFERLAIALRKLMQTQALGLVIGEAAQLASSFFHR